MSQRPTVPTGRGFDWANVSSALTRGVLKRCPRCGAREIFESYFTLKDRCPQCGVPFEREQGYWTGAMIVNIAACEVWFFILFVGTVLVTAPNIKWELLLIIALITNGLLPIVFYPLSKTLWMALDLHYQSDASNNPPNVGV